MQASNNNRARTVLDVFRTCIGIWGMPSRLRGDHGTENVEVAAYIIYYRGPGRGSYMWGRWVSFHLDNPYIYVTPSLFRSVHNTRIERLWVDLKVQLIHKWVAFFSTLELHHALNAANQNHRWLLQYLFLVDINREIQRFVEAWNNHPLKRDGERTRTPLDLFHWDMQTNGIRGDLEGGGEFP